MKHITLINAPFLKQSTYSITFTRKPYPNLSLSYLAGYLRTNGIPVSVIDAKYFKLSVHEIIDKLHDIKPDIIGFTSMTTEIDDVVKTISEIKKAFPNSLSIIGGVHASALPAKTLKSNKDIDVVAVGEGEGILSDLAKGMPLIEISGIYYYSNGEVKKTEERLNENLNGFGSTAFDLWPNAHFFFIPTYTGCPFNCSFCFRVLGKRIRLRKIEHVMKDIEYVASNNAEMDICDATFGLNRQHTINILKKMVECGFNVPWNTATRVDMVDEELLKLMKDAGCNTVAFGIESGSNLVLDNTGKQITIERAQKAVEMVKKIGLKTTGYYVFGHPNEEKSDIQATMRMVWQLNTDIAIIGIMTPWPGTHVYNLAKRGEGGYTLIHEKYESYDKHYGSAIKFKAFSMRWLENMRVITYLNLYIRNFRLIDLLTFFWDRRINIALKLFNILKHKKKCKINCD